MERQSERKNNRSKAGIIIVAMLLMVALVVGMGAMTYSRYITSETTSQNATAAKWGFVLNVNANNLFGTDYTKASGKTYAEVVKTSEEIGVAVDAESKAVAPGTTGSMTIGISGTAEVKAKLTISFVKPDSLSGSEESVKEIHYGTDYYPVKWTLNDGTTDVAKGKLSDIQSYLTNSSANIINAGTVFDETNKKEYTLSWEWAFDGEGVDNAKDTAIGKKANDSDYTENGVEIEPQMSFKIVVSVEQIQE